MWLKELNFFLSMIQRIEPLFEYDSKNRTHFCLNTTQWIDPIFWMWLKNWNFWLKNSQNFELFLSKSKLNFSSHDSKNWTFFSLNMTQRIEPLFLWIWRKELNPCFFEYDAKNWTLVSLNMTQRRIERKELNLFLWIWREELNLLLMRRKELNLFLICLKELSLFSKYDSKNWTSLSYELFLHDSKNLTLFFKKNMIQRIESLSEYDSKNRTLFFIRLNESNPFFWMGLKLKFLVEK